MAEIKSAIELAMERTRNLVMDEGEKEESRRKETEAKLRAVLRRFLEGMIDEDGAMDEVDAVPDDGALKRRVLVSLLLDDLDITKENGRLLSFLGRAAGELPRSLMEELHDMEAEFTREMTRKESGVRDEVVGRLAAMGVTGDGLEPNVESWEEWRLAREETGRAFATDLKAWKEKARHVLDKG